MLDVAQNMVDGIMIGSSYGLLAIGFTLVFGVMRRLNLSYGPSIMLGAYGGTLLYLDLGAPPILVALATVAGAVIVGLYVERLCFAPLTGRAGAGIASMVSSFAIWMQLEQAGILVLPRHTYAYPSLLPDTVLSFGPLFARIDHLAMLAGAVLIAVLLHLLLHRSRLGLALRAVVENRTAAQLIGIDVPLLGMLAFALASAIGGIAGYLVLAADQQVTPMFGMWATLKGLVAMMIGGLGSLPGAVLGGLLLGVVEMQSLWYLGPQGRDLSTYLLLFLVLVLRPGGLFAGAALRERLAQDRRERWTSI